MRVAPNLEPEVLAGIQRSAANLQTALQQVSTGQRVNRPSDDPTASAALVQNLAVSSNDDQYTKNASAALGTAQAADSVITSVVSLLTQTVALGTQGATGTNTAQNRQVIATQVQGVLTSVISAANTNYQGTTIFGGSSNTSAAFIADASSPTGYTYKGDSGINEVQVGSSLQVQLNVPGDQLFTNTKGNVIASLAQLVTALQTGTQAAIANATNSVTAALNFVSSQHAVFGNSINQLNAQESFLGQEKITLSTQQNSLVGIDLAVAAENLTQAQVQNSAVLAAAAKVLPITLLDYLK